MVVVVVVVSWLCLSVFMSAKEAGKRKNEKKRRGKRMKNEKMDLVDRPLVVLLSFLQSDVSLGSFSDRNDDDSCYFLRRTNNQVEKQQQHQQQKEQDSSFSFSFYQDEGEDEGLTDNSIVFWFCLFFFVGCVLID